MGSGGFIIGLPFVRASATSRISSAAAVMRRRTSRMPTRPMTASPFALLVQEAAPKDAAKAAHKDTRPTTSRPATSRPRRQMTRPGRQPARRRPSLRGRPAQPGKPDKTGQERRQDQSRPTSGTSCAGYDGRDWPAAAASRCRRSRRRQSGRRTAAGRMTTLQIDAARRSRCTAKTHRRCQRPSCPRRAAAACRQAGRQPTSNGRPARIPGPPAPQLRPPQPAANAADTCSAGAARPRDQRRSTAHRRPRRRSTRRRRSCRPDAGRAPMRPDRQAGASRPTGQSDAPTAASAKPTAKADDAKTGKATLKTAR